MSEDHANQLPSDQSPTPDAETDAATAADAGESVSAEPDAADSDADERTADSGITDADVPVASEALAESSPPNGSATDEASEAAPEDDAIAAEPPQAETVPSPAPSANSPSKPPSNSTPRRLEMTDADSFGSGDAFSTVIRTAQETFDQVWAVLQKLWDVIAPIVRSVAILILRLLILTLQWALEQIEQTVPSTGSAITPTQPKAAGTVTAATVKPTSDRADTPDSLTSFGEVDEDADTSEEAAAIALDDSADASDANPPAAADAPDLEAAVVSTPQSVQTEEDSSSANESDTSDRPLALRIVFTVLGVAWTILVKLGNLILPNRISDKLPNPVVGGLMTAIVVGILWITVSIRSAPPSTSAPEPAPGLSVPMDLTVENEADVAEERPTEETPDEAAEDVDAEDSAEPIAETATETEPAIAPETKAEPEADAPATEAPTTNPQADVSLSNELLDALRDQIAEVSDDYGTDLIQSVQANFLSGRLALTVSRQWNDLDGDRPQVAKALWQRSQEYGFTKLEIVDREGQVLARSPVVGKEMLMFERSAVDDPVDQPDEATHEATLDEATNDAAMDAAIAEPESAAPSEPEPAAEPADTSEPQDMPSPNAAELDPVQETSQRSPNQPLLFAAVESRVEPERRSQSSDTAEAAPIVPNPSPQFQPEPSAHRSTDNPQPRPNARSQRPGPMHRMHSKSMRRETHRQMPNMQMPNRDGCCPHQPDDSFSKTPNPSPYRHGPAPGAHIV